MTAARGKGRNERGAALGYEAQLWEMADIKGLRERLSPTQKQFAENVRVTDSTVNHWRNGKRVELPSLVQRRSAMKQDRNEDESKAPKGRAPR